MGVVDDCQREIIPEARLGLESYKELNLGWRTIR
jgi:hypothetical protein